MDTVDKPSFQELWRITVGQSGVTDPQLVKEEILERIMTLKNGLKYFKKYSEESKTKLNKIQEISAEMKSFVCKLSVFLDLNCVQALDIVQQYSRCDFHGSKKKFRQVLADERSSLTLLGKITEYYFAERLYLLRTIKHMFSHLQDTHRYHEEYSEIITKIPDLNKTILSQYKEQFSSDPPSSKTRGPNFTTQVVAHFALQDLKEQCEFLETLFLYYVHFDMKTGDLVKLAKAFKEQGFGEGHPLLEVVDMTILGPLLTRINAMQQIILIAGCDMEYLQRLAEADCLDQHQFHQNKNDFKELDKILVSLTDSSVLSPLVLAWATVRYQLLPDNGGEMTQRMGESSIDLKVWLQIINILEMYPFNCQSPVAIATKNVFRGLLSCVAHSFHEETLGDYSDLINVACRILSGSKTAAELFWADKKRGTGLHMLLSFTSGFFPLHLDLMIKLLMSLTTGEKSSYEAHCYVRYLPTVAEYLAARGTDDVESAEDGSYWKLIAHKHLAVAGGLHAIKIPTGTVGHLVDTQLGAMVQWKTSVNGWKIFLAEIQSVLQYRGQSSDLEVLGYVDKAMLIYGLVEKMLVSMASGTESNMRNEALATIEPFIENIFPLVQRLINMASPSLDLIGRCIRCATLWIKCDRAEQSSEISFSNNSKLVSVVSLLTRIQFLPFSDRNFLQNLTSSSKYDSALSVPIHPGVYGNILTNAEQPNNRYPITVAALDLVQAMVERTINWNSGVKFPDNDEFDVALLVEAVAPSILFFLQEVFPTFHKWRRDPETSEKIGLKCLSLCHTVLRSYHLNISSRASDLDQNTTDPTPSPSIWSPVQLKTLQILTHSHSADIILKLLSVPIDTIHALISSEPTSPIVTNILEMVILGFSVLNNILRLERDVVNESKKDQSGSGVHKIEEQLSSYLHAVLSAHKSSGALNLISVVAGYLYHRHNVVLPRIAVVLLKRISLAAPMSLHASLGADVAAVRDVLLTRLRSRTEDLHLKIGILEFLTVSVQTQPGLLELFLDLEPVEKDKPEKGLKLGKSSCLTAVLDLIEAEKQGTFELPAKLHAACAKLLSSLWVDRRHSALEALRSYSLSSKASFWHSFLLPLFSDNPPREVAQSDLLETCAHILNTLGLESFYTTPKGKDPALEPIMGNFYATERYNHWSKVPGMCYNGISFSNKMPWFMGTPMEGEVLVCVSKTLPKLTQSERGSRLMFIAAWRTFILTVKIKDPILIKKWVDDILMAICALVLEIDVHEGIATALNLITSLLLTLVHRSPEKTFGNSEVTEKVLLTIVKCLKDIDRSQETLSRTRVHLHAIALHLFAKLKPQRKDEPLEFSKDIALWLQVTCSNLQETLKVDLNTCSNLKQISETSLLLIQTIQSIHAANDSEEYYTKWHRILVEESTFNLLSSVLLYLVARSHQDEDGNVLKASLAMSILRMFQVVSKHRTSAMTILQTGILPEFCLKTSNTYVKSTTGKQKKWVNVYHLSIMFMQSMLDSLSHDFLDNALDFIGVHHDRIGQCLEAVRLNQNTLVLREAAYTTALLSSLMKNFIREWRFKLLHSFQSCVENVATLCHSCVAMLQRPRLLQEAIEFSSKKDDSVQIPMKALTSAVTRQTSVAARKSMSQDDIEETSPKFLSAQSGLLAILGNCLTIFKHLSPDLCQVLLDQTVDPEEFHPLLLIGFSMPSLEQTAPTFGTVVNAANLSWKILSKSPSTHLHNLASYVMDTALTVAVAQGTLLLKHPLVSSRDKQRLRRELGDELVSCLRGPNRHYRHSSGGVASPQSSPSAGSKATILAKSAGVKQSPAGSGPTAVGGFDRGMLDLVDLFVRQVLR